MRSTFGTIGVILNYYAIDKLVLSDANMLNKLSPFLSVLLCAWFLKEKINKRQIISILIAFTGALLIIKPTFSIEVLAGVFASLGQFGITLAYRYAPAKEISIFDYTNIIFSAILSIFIFNQYPDILSTIGYIVVFSAAFYTFLYNKKLDKMEKEN